MLYMSTNPHKHTCLNVLGLIGLVAKLKPAIWLAFDLISMR